VTLPGRSGVPVCRARRLARVLLASQFVYGGYHAAKNPGRRPEALDRAGVPGGADLVRVNGAAMVAGGIALGLGVLPRLASVGLIASLSQRPSLDIRSGGSTTHPLASRRRSSS
jgi:hypothetical protein